MSEEEREIARIKRNANRSTAYEKRTEKRLRPLRAVKSNVEPLLEVDGPKFIKILMGTMSKKELLNVLEYILQVIPVLCERHKDELLELIRLQPSSRKVTQGE
jgi:hypothetical protein